VEFGGQADEKTYDFRIKSRLAKASKAGFVPNRSLIVGRQALAIFIGPIPL